MVKRAKKKAKRKPLINGRNGKGQFEKGNKAAVGRENKPVDKKARELKKALLDSITEDDIKKISRKLVAKAKAGDVQATKELFDRLWGRAIQEVDIGEETRKTMFDILAVCGLSSDNGD